MARPAPSLLGRTNAPVVACLTRGARSSHAISCSRERTRLDTTSAPVLRWKRLDDEEAPMAVNERTNTHGAQKERARTAPRGQLHELDVLTAVKTAKAAAAERVASDSQSCAQCGVCGGVSRASSESSTDKGARAASGSSVGKCLEELRSVAVQRWWK